MPLSTAGFRMIGALATADLVCLASKQTVSGGREEYSVHFLFDGNRGHIRTDSVNHCRFGFEAALHNRHRAKNLQVVSQLDKVSVRVLMATRSQPRLTFDEAGFAPRKLPPA